MRRKLIMCITVILSVMSLCSCGGDLGTKMTKAGMNTMMGMGTVFFVLILIALLISLFKYISVAEKYFKERKNKANAPAATQPAASEVQPEDDTEEIDDLELVAVISAAIAAYTGTDLDKLVVRKIRRRSSNRW